MASSALLHLPGTAGNYASVPDSAALSITGDIDVRILLTIPSTQTAVVIGKQTTSQRSWALQPNVTANDVYWAWTVNGSTLKLALSTVAYTSAYALGTKFWLRVTHDVDNGAAGNDVKFYTAPGTIATPVAADFTQLGATVTGAGTTSIFDSTTIVEFGATFIGTLLPFLGDVYRAQIRNGIDGTLVLDANFVNVAYVGTRNPSSFVESSSNAATVTVNGSAWDWYVTSSVTPAAIVATVASPSAAAATSASPVPAAATAALPVAQSNGSAVPAILPAAVALPAATSVVAVVPTAVAAIVAVPSGQQSGSVGTAVLAALVAVPAPSLEAGQTASPSPAALLAAFLAPTIDTGAGSQPAMLTTAFGAPSLSGFAGPALVVSAVAILAVTATGGVSTSPQVLAALVSFSQPNANSSVSPAAAAVVVVLLQPTITTFEPVHIRYFDSGPTVTRHDSTSTVTHHEGTGP